MDGLVFLVGVAQVLGVQLLVSAERDATAALVIVLQNKNFN